MKNDKKLILIPLSVFIILLLAFFISSWYEINSPSNGFLKGEITVSVDEEDVDPSLVFVKTGMDYAVVPNQIEWEFGENEDAITYYVTTSEKGFYDMTIELPKELFSNIELKEPVQYKISIFGKLDTKERIDIDINISNEDGEYKSIVTMTAEHLEKIYEKEIITNGETEVVVGWGP